MMMMTLTSCPFVTEVESQAVGDKVGANEVPSSSHRHMVIHKFAPQHSMDSLLDHEMIATVEAADPVLSS